jgi:multiple sugar transport system substrate-binding protein
MMHWPRAFGPSLLGIACLSAIFAGCTPAVSRPAARTSAVAPSALPNPAGGSIQFMVWGQAAQLHAYQTLVERYQQLHPGQAVALATIPNQSDYQKRLSADFTSGSPADVIVLSYLNLASFASRGLLTPVGSLLSASQAVHAQDFYSQALGPFVYNRQIECLPQNVSGLVVYYNKDLFRQANLPAPRPNWSWDDFLADARALTRRLAGSGGPDQYGLGLEPTLPNWAPFIWQSQGRVVDSGSWPSELALNTPAVLTASTWLVNLQTQYHVVPDAQAELAASSEQRFLDGTLAMYVNTRQGVPAYRQIASFDWDVAPLPANGGRATNVVFADGYCLTAASSHKAAAWQFIQLAASAEGQSILAQSGAVVPSLPAVANSSAFLDPGARPAHSQVFLDAVPQAIALPILENWTDIAAIADEELQQAFYGQKDLAQALAAATLRSDEYFKVHSAH